jgi:hypothetical protein
VLGGLSEESFFVVTTRLVSMGAIAQISKVAHE